MELNFMFFVQETPGKVMSLLGAAMFSMFLLFGVSLTNANFVNTENSMPDVFAPTNVVSFIDQVSADYSQFVYTLAAPAEQSYALAADNLSFIIDEASPSILAYTGLTELADIDRVNSVLPQVAGAYTEQVSYASANDSLSVDKLYDTLIGEY